MNPNQKKKIEQNFSKIWQYLTGCDKMRQIYFIKGG